MAFTTLCWINRFKQWFKPFSSLLPQAKHRPQATAFATVGCALILLLLSSMVLGSFGARVEAAEIEITNPALNVGDDGLIATADFAFELNPRLEEAVARGVSLYFLIEFEITRPRWYWLDEKTLSRSKTYQLSYHALTRQYRLSTGGSLHQSFSSLSEALRMLSRLRNWLVLDKVTDKGVLKIGETYQASLRMRLDTSQLPKPFQITALANRDWNLSSDWARWLYVMPAFPASDGK